MGSRCTTKKQKRGFIKYSTFFGYTQNPPKSSATKDHRWVCFGRQLLLQSRGPYDWALNKPGRVPVLELPPPVQQKKSGVLTKEFFFKKENYHLNFSPRT